MRDRSIVYRPDIDALRGLSILLVVLFHAFPQWIPGGFVGVDVFFVISGYLITSIILRSMAVGNFSLIDFYSKRIRRLFPALITVLSSAMVLGWLVLFPDELKQLGEHAKYSAFYMLNFQLIDEIGYFDVESHYKPLLHLWSLSVEEQFYLLWPLVLIALCRLGVCPLYLLAVTAILSILAIGHYASSDLIHYHTLTRVWQLSAGAMVATFFHGNVMISRPTLAMVGALLILIYAVTVGGEHDHRLVLSVFPVFGAVLVVMSNTQVKQYLGFRWLGLISYPLYLWHWLLISFLTIYVGQQPENEVLLIAVLISIALAWLTYRYVEKIRYRPGTTAPYLFLVLILLGFVGLFLQKMGGLPDRAHLWYLVDNEIQFTRTPAVDAQCDRFSKQSTGKARLFYYCRGERLDDAAHIVAVIGDSHAHALYPGIKKEASRRGWETILLANSGCPTLIGFKWGSSNKERAACQRKIAQIFEIIAADARINKVIVATRGPVYLHGEVEGRYTAEAAKNSLLKVNTKHPKASYDSFENSLSATVSKLRHISHVVDVQYMLENPELDFLPKEMVIRPFDLFGLSANRAFISRVAYDIRMKEYRESVKHAVAESGGRVLDPAPALCDAKKCTVRKNGQFLYADDDHFSVAGSKYIASYFSDVIFDEVEPSFSQ